MMLSALGALAEIDRLRLRIIRAGLTATVAGMGIAALVVLWR